MWSVEEAARLLGISRAHAYELVARGELPHLRLGRRVVVPSTRSRRSSHASARDRQTASTRTSMAASREPSTMRSWSTYSTAPISCTHLHWQCETSSIERGAIGVEHREARPGQESYYLETVANGVEDYYVGHGEAPGRWLGTHARRARSRRSGRRRGTPPGPRRPSIRPPENASPAAAIAGSRASISRSAPRSRCPVLWGLGDRDISRRGTRPRTTAASMPRCGYLEDRRAGRGGAPTGIVTLRGDGFVAAGFRHRTSRAGDPHLHTSRRRRERDPQRGWPLGCARRPAPLPARQDRRLPLRGAPPRPSSPRRLGVAWGTGRQRASPTSTGSRPRCSNGSRLDGARSRPRWPTRGVSSARRCAVRGARNPPSQGLRRRTVDYCTPGGPNRSPRPDGTSIELAAGARTVDCPST